MNTQFALDFEHVGCDPLYVVTFAGPFAFIKPWTAVRDAKTYSQAFLTPSIVEGIRQRLGVSQILRHRLAYAGIELQLERTQTAGWEQVKGTLKRSLSILERGVLIHPTLHLAFASLEDAESAASEAICLCRNEDLLLPVGTQEMSAEEFDTLDGFELIFGNGPGSFLVGYNRFEQAAPMYGSLVIVRGSEQ